MAPSLPTFDFRRLRLYVVRLPLFTRIVLVLIAFFFVIELQHAWDVVQWGALFPKHVHFHTSKFSHESVFLAQPLPLLLYQL